jgi:Raf kinase inhibitor-like YbhB/YbcL family protein
MALQLESTAFSNDKMIPSKYTCDGSNISPPLEWSGVPDDTESFAIIFDDPDAPSKTWVHWVLFNIPASQQQLEENIPPNKELDNGAMHGINDFKKHSYGGPCPPGGTHGYYMKLYALDTKLDLKPGVTKQQLIDAMDGHILDKTELVGKYKRS